MPRRNSFIVLNRARYTRYIFLIITTLLSVSSWNDTLSVIWKKNSISTLSYSLRTTPVLVEYLYQD